MYRESRSKTVQQRILLNRQEIEKIVLDHLHKTQRIPPGVNPKAVAGVISAQGLHHPPHSNSDISLMWSAYVEWDEKLPEGE